jgi:hypothetical protein
MRRSNRVVLALAGCALLALGGCYDDVDYEAERLDVPPPPAAEPEPVEEGPITQAAGGGGRSSLGAAKRSAKNTVGAVEARNAELEKEMEDQ